MVAGPMFDAYTKSHLTALLAGRICAHQLWVRKALYAGDSARIGVVLDQAASASAEATTIARIIGIGPLPKLSKDDKTADAQANPAVIRATPRLTTNLN